MPALLFSGKAFAAAVTAVVLLAAATDAAAEPIVQIEFFDIDQDGFNEPTHAKIRRLHEGMLNRGEIYAWYDYTVRHPLGDRAEYDHVVVTVFVDEKYLAPRNDGMPTLKGRVKTEYARADREMRSPGYDTIPSLYTTVNFFYADPSDKALEKALLAEWKLSLDKDYYEPGLWTTWSKFNMPDVPKKQGYNFVIVTRHNDYPSTEKPIEIPADLKTRVHLVKSQLWRTHDILMPIAN